MRGIFDFVILMLDQPTTKLNNSNSEIYYYHVMISIEINTNSI